jgi:hypothetical protein
MTPDHRAIIGEAPEAKGLFFAKRMQRPWRDARPVSGRITPNLILNGRSELIDTSLPGAQRFRLRAAAGRNRAL